MFSLPSVTGPMYPGGNQSRPARPAIYNPDQPPPPRSMAPYTQPPLIAAPPPAYSIPGEWHQLSRIRRIEKFTCKSYNILYFLPSGNGICQALTLKDAALMIMRPFCHLITCVMLNLLEGM